MTNCVHNWWDSSICRLILIPDHQSSAFTAIYCNKLSNRISVWNVYWLIWKWFWQTWIILWCKVSFEIPAINKLLYWSKIKLFWHRYSHLSNKREVTLTDFEKFHPPQKNPPSTFIDFLDFFHPPLLVSYIYVLVFSKKSHPPCLFQPPRLVIWQLFHPLHVYSNLQAY